MACGVGAHLNPTSEVGAVQGILDARNCARIAGVPQMVSLQKIVEVYSLPEPLPSQKLFLGFPEDVVVENSLDEEVRVWLGLRKECCKRRSGASGIQQLWLEHARRGRPGRGTSSSRGRLARPLAPGLACRWL